MITFQKEVHSHECWTQDIECVASSTLNAQLLHSHSCILECHLDCLLDCVELVSSICIRVCICVCLSGSSALIGHVCRKQEHARGGRRSKSPKNDLFCIQSAATHSHVSQLEPFQLQFVAVIVSYQNICSDLCGIPCVRRYTGICTHGARKP